MTALRRTALLLLLLLSLAISSDATLLFHDNKSPARWKQQSSLKRLFEKTVHRPHRLISRPPSAFRGGSSSAPRKSLKDVVCTYGSLGCLAFGGVPGHFAILREGLMRRSWLSHDAFMELFAILQGVPGPTSLQLVVATAACRTGILGGIVAGVLWSLPGFLVLTTAGVLSCQFKTAVGLLRGVAPVMLAFSVKTAAGAVSSLRGSQRFIAFASWMVVTYGKRQQSFYLCPCLLLLLGGLITFFEDVAFFEEGARQQQPHPTIRIFTSRLMLISQKLYSV